MTTDIRQRLRRIDPAPVEADPPVGALDAFAVLQEIERRMGMEPRTSAGRSTTTDESESISLEPPAPTPVRPTGPRRGVALGIATFAVALVAVVVFYAISALFSDSEDLPAEEVPPAPEVAAVLAALDAYNAGDLDAYVAAFDPAAEDVNADELNLVEIFMNANARHDVVGDCTVGSEAGIVVECTLDYFDDFHGPAGLAGTGVSRFHLDDELRITLWEGGFDCCDRQFVFNSAFNTWMLTDHFDVYTDIRPLDIESLPGWRGDPADMAIAIQYVEEFLEQSDTYPLQAGS